MSVDQLFMHTATVKPFLGSGPTGPLYGPPVSLTGLLDDGQAQTPTAGGYQLVSKTTFYTHIENAASFAVRSQITCNGRTMSVTGFRRRDGGWMLAGVTHLEVDVE